MAKLADLLEKQVQINQDITDERKKGAGVRDRLRVKELQNKYKEITAVISKHHEDDRVTPVDKSDNSEKEFKVKTEEKRKKKLKESESKSK